ncbi:unnamed protein product (macronuclear) [Paramecium tetraurelia]|uniref:Chromosome undetermined scaffold_17, whole genome shotgun sequence n=1 Tax=Paramecium tetraurelia TaxID=5888 RepID=Q7Z103_PARTE|nr:uncharacterized protein GSPATT00007249001 [Paramecium tetraurelia]CAD97574.1 nd2-like protein [Paramecium tetraurelia]CAK69037.1 unnamed protein product [Paramecium tetraurelia]|eukprot:XP_001436434.1 hypothetical protein (macronuclear) [Paramecium tetraurelia strain d4-2]
MLIYILLLGLINTQNGPVLIEKFGRSKKKQVQAPPPDFECIDELDEDDAPPKEYPLKVGSLYHLSDGWYLRSEDSTNQQVTLINMNDISRIKFVEKEIEATLPDKQPEQKLKDMEWTPLLAFERFPRQRGGHSMHSIGDYVVLFGGCLLNIQCFNDLFLFNARTRIWTTPKVFGIPPVGRSGFGSLVNGARLYIFGGHTMQGLVNDLFVFDLESRSWNQLSWPGQAPTPRAGHKMVLTKLGGLIFGGFVGEVYTSDIFILDFVNERWGKPSGGGDVPLGRESFSMTYHHGLTYVFGGYAKGLIMNDLYTINEDLIWQKREVQGDIPSPRQGAAMAEYDNRIFIVGGCNPILFECYNDVYTLDTQSMTFTNVTVEKQRNLRQVAYSSMVFAGSLLIHFGGCKLLKHCSDSLIGLAVASAETCPPCKNDGECRAGHCSCKQGWQGIDCTQKVLCKQNCLEQGICLSNGYCKCYPGYTGSVCQLNVPCPGNCTDEEHGICELDGKCKCFEGFSGVTCSGNPEIDSKLPQSTGCLDECNHRGQCNFETGLCACEDGFSGPDCSLVQGTESGYTSIWDLLKDYDGEHENDLEPADTGEEDLKQFISTGYKFNQRQEGPMPMFDDDIDRVYYVDVDENGHVVDDNHQNNHNQDDNVQKQDNKNEDNNNYQQSLQYDPKFKPYNIQEGNNNNLNILQSNQNPFSFNFMMVPPKVSSKEEDPFKLLLLDECPKRCSEHGVCIENECYCWFGYTGDWCQAEKISDFYKGWTKKGVIEACIVSFIVGMIIGYGVVLLMKKRGNNDEFRNMSEVPSQNIDDNEGEVEEQII